MPRSTREAGGILVVSHGEWLPYLLGGGTVAMLATAAYDVTIGSRGTGRMAGLLVGAAVLGAGAAALSENARFVFDPGVRTIAWRRHWLFRRRGGMLRFGDVASVVFQVSIASRRVPGRRVVLRLTDGSDLPLTVSYSPDPGGAMRTVADDVAAVLGLSAVIDDAAQRA